MDQVSVRIVMVLNNAVNVMDRALYTLLDTQNSLRRAKHVAVQELVKDVRFPTDNTQVVVVQQVLVTVLNRLENEFQRFFRLVYFSASRWKKGNFFYLDL